MMRLNHIAIVVECQIVPISALHDMDLIFDGHVLWQGIHMRRSLGAYYECCKCRHSLLTYTINEEDIIMKTTTFKALTRVLALLLCSSLGAAFVQTSNNLTAQQARQIAKDAYNSNW